MCAQAHVELAARLKKRDPGCAPNVGDRIPYVMVKGAVGAKAWEKAEDPVFVLEQSLQLDTEWYLQHQLAEPIKRLFDPIVDNTSSLLEGDHTRRIKKATPTRGGLMGFVKVTQRCIGCRANLDEKKQDGAALCINCKPREAELYLGKLAQLQQNERFFWQAAHCTCLPAGYLPLTIGNTYHSLLRTHSSLSRASHSHLLTYSSYHWLTSGQIFVAAQRVQADNLKDVLGIARDSPLYYQMKKVQIDLKEAREQLARFDDGVVA